MARETILILDTDRNITWTLKTLLESEHYPVVIADSVERATRNFSEFRVSGFITEYWIENVPTVKAIQKLKEVFPESYVMMITDKDMEEDEYEEIMRLGVDDFFLKPMPIKKILLHLQKGLRHGNLLVEKDRLEKEMASLRSERKEIAIPQGEEALRP
jgi:two-component system, NtrC family, nitrogen regulation response regulator NtrX